VHVLAPKPQQEGLQQAGRQNDARFPRARILACQIPPFAAG
jgi:hypothetical protein